MSLLHVTAGSSIAGGMFHSLLGFRLYAPPQTCMMWQRVLRRLSTPLPTLPTLTQPLLQDSWNQGTSFIDIVWACLNLTVQGSLFQNYQSQYHSCFYSTNGRVNSQNSRPCSSLTVDPLKGIAETVTQQVRNRQSSFKGSEVPKYGVSMVSALRIIIIMIWGMYHISGYLDGPLGIVSKHHVYPSPSLSSFLRLYCPTV